MKLYGLAVAVVPKKENPFAFDVTCTPVAVVDGNYEKFEILDDLKFKETVDNGNTRQVMDCFIRTVNVLDSLVKLQSKSCEEAHIDYRPVALEIGEANKNPVSVNAFYTHLFGKSFSSHRTLEDYLETVPRHQAASLVAQDQRARRARDRYEHDHRELPFAFTETCQKLAGLLKQCSLAKGSFTMYGDQIDISTLQETRFDRDLIALKRKVDAGDFEAHRQLIEIARTKGKECGRLHNSRPQLFAHFAPHGYKDNEKVQQQYPRYAFFHWDPEYQRAFREGFEENSWGPRVRHFKLPLDATSPPFTDPVADRIREEFEIVNQLKMERGEKPFSRARRIPEAIVDHPSWRHKIIRSAQEVSEKNPVLI